MHSGSQVFDVLMQKSTRLNETSRSMSTGSTDPVRSDASQVKSSTEDLEARNMVQMVWDLGCQLLPATTRASPLFRIATAMQQNGLYKLSMSKSGNNNRNKTYVRPQRVETAF